MAENEQLVLTRAQLGDADAFRRLVENHQRFAFNVAFRLLADEENARDVVQECFIRLWKYLPRFDVRKKLRTWLYKIITNLCYDEMRRAYNRYKSRPGENETSLANLVYSENIDDVLTNVDLAEKITRLSAFLKPRQRVVFVLRDLEDLELDEIALILKTSVGLVKSNLYYARCNIRKKCQELGYNQ